jgi:uncharacterized protein (TIGR03435 family)
MNTKSGFVSTPIVVALTLTYLTLLPTAGFGQSQSGHPQFEAASIRINQSNDRPSTRYDAGRVELHKASLKHLVRRGWPVPDYQIVWPSWVGDQRGAIGYDVSVTFPAGTSEENVQLMFQDLMTTRFGMTMHWEPRDLRVFEVRASEHGPKLHEAQNPALPTDYPKYSTRIERGEWHMSSQLAGSPSGLSIAGFLEAITQLRILDRPIIDATGIQGNYDIELTAPVEAPENKPDQVELLNALDKQLGLKATPKTLPLKVLVVDHLERTPTDN